jgi:hypothetical protein
MTCQFSELMETIQNATVPKWLREYVQVHRLEMIDSLTRFDEYTIIIPDGGQIIIKRNARATGHEPRPSRRPNCF